MSRIASPGETPLQCGYRIYKPSYALIYLGIADMGFYTEKQFHDNLIKIIHYLSNHGVVPILSTFPMADSFNDGKPQFFNAVVRDVATSQNVPLIATSQQGRSTFQYIWFFHPL